MSSHLRFSGQPFEIQRRALEEIIRAEPVLMTVLTRLREIDLPDWLLVSGAIYNTVWNALTHRPSLTGINDIDVAYFAEDDLSYEGEDRIIRSLAERFADMALPVQVRNQARVHLWFPEKFSQPFAPLKSSGESLNRYASRTHAVAVRLEQDDTLTVLAPFGLDLIFSFRIAPNHVLDNRATHDSKAARAKQIWPELTVEPW